MVLIKWIQRIEAISLIVFLSLLPIVRFRWPSKENFEQILSKVTITCRTVQNHNIVSPEVRWVVLSVHLDIGKTTGVWRSSWIIATFASDMNFHHRPRNCQNDNNDKESFRVLCTYHRRSPGGWELQQNKTLWGLMARFKYFTTEVGELWNFGGSFFSNASQPGNIRVLREVKTESCLKLFQTKE